VASHQRETISSESQRKNSTFNNGPSGAVTLACPRSAASINGHGSSPSTTARSLQRALSKSREVLYERVAASNLRKSTSKSRERLCEMRLSISRSRDHLCDEFRSSAAQSRERLHSLRNFSKSHEVLSLLNEQGSTITVADSCLFNNLPSTQSLEYFKIPNLDRDESLEVLQNINKIFTNVTSPGESPTTDEVLELNKVLSESTETLCDETETVTLMNVLDEVTPSNSRSVTPTQDDLIDQKAEQIILKDESVTCEENEIGESPIGVQPQEELKFESLITRADAVASSLKRLSSNGPPSLKTSPFSESLSPALGKSVWNWPTSNTNVIEGTPTSPTSTSSSLSSNVTLGHSARKNLPSPSSFKLKDQQPSTSPLPADELLTVVLRTDAAFTSDSPHSLSSIPVKTTDPLTPARMSSTSIDTASLSDSQRQLLTSCLTRRRASWACGSRQEDVSSIITVPSISVSKQPETKLSVSELITSFNKCKQPGNATNSTATVISNTGMFKPNNVKKLTVGSIFHQDSPVLPPGLSSSGKVMSEKEKTVFKPVSTSIQVFQKNLTITPVATPTSLLMGTVQRNFEVLSRPRSSWEVRALPRLPEDTVCSLRQDDQITSVASESGVDKGSEDKILEDPKEKTVTAVEVEEDYGLRSGSVSSDTGCSSSSDLSDRSSDEGLDANREHRRKKNSGRECGNGSEPEADLIEGALTSSPVSWTGRPRSFSVQSEISLLAQPWNRVCIGSVARAFEKFGTKVDVDTSSSSGINSPSSTSSTHRSRRQSTPGPFK
jgi:hypothetical protein